MEFTLLFAALTATLLAAWWGSRTLALMLFRHVCRFGRNLSASCDR
jgi:fucose 4-O-acetylase-like acetyltransferase